MHKKKGTGLEPWPARLTAAPPRLEEIGVSPYEFHKDTVSCVTRPYCQSSCVYPIINHFLVQKHLSITKIFMCCRASGITE